MSVRNWISRSLLFGCVTLVIVVAHLAGNIGSAAAFMGYGPGIFFGTAGTGDGQFSSPSGIAVEESSGDVYVADQGNNRVEKFDAEGKYLSQFNGSADPAQPGGFSGPTGVAVDNSSGVSKGDVYVVDSGHDAIEKFSSTGSFVFELNGFANPVVGVTVDSNGDVWVAEKEETGEEHGPVREFDGAEHNTQIGFSEPEFKRASGIAVDSEGKIYLFRGNGQLAKFNGAGVTEEEELDICECGTGVAVDSGTQDLFVDQGSSVARFGAFGLPYREPEETLGGISSSEGIAVNGATHTVYASEREADAIAMFKLLLFPDVTTLPAAEVDRTSVKLEGEVNPDGQEVTSCIFEYGASETYGQTAPCINDPGSGSSPVAVSAQLSGLSPATAYHYRLVAGNTNGTHAGSDQTTTTPPAVEGTQALAATDVEGTTAALNGSLAPNGYDTHYFFEYGLGQPSGFVTTSQDAGSATEDKLVSTTVSDLVPHQTYNFRLVGENSFGQTDSDEETFTTPAVAPSIPGSPTASFITTQSAVLNSSLNPEHTTTSYHFEYGACPSLVGCEGVQSTANDLSGVYGTIGTTQEIVGLAPATTYAYRLVADNEFEEGGKTLGGRTDGTEGTFTTEAAVPPSVQTGTPSAITPTSAIISGTVEPKGLPATYSFEIGVYDGGDTQYGVVFSGSAGASTAPVEESLSLAGLQPDTTYAYRLTVSSGYIANETHTSLGAAATFTTGGLPSALVLPPVLAQLPIPAIAFPKATSLKRATKSPAKKCKKGYSRNKRGKCLKLKPKNKKMSSSKAKQRKG